MHRGCEKVFLESLESRIAPATLVNASTVAYQDADGDAVTIKFSKNVVTSEAAMSDLFSFTSGPDGKETLNSINLTGLNSKQFAHVDISLIAEQAGNGDGQVNLAFLNAAGLDLGKVSVDGALAKITAGDSKLNTAALKSLNVDSLGLADGSQPNSLTQTTSILLGRVGKLEVTHDVAYALFSVEGNTAARIDSIFIGGSILGGAEDKSGLIRSLGKIGKVQVEGSIVGSAGEYSGVILAEDGFKSATIGGSLVGGSGKLSGGIISDACLGNVIISQDIVGGDGEKSGFVSGYKGIGKILVKGDVLGGTNYSAGRIESIGNIKQIEINGDLEGGTADYAGSVYAGGSISEIFVQGNLQGATHIGTGSIFSNKTINKVVVKGDLNGGTGYSSAYIQAQGSIHRIIVEGDLQGGAGDRSGSIMCFSGKLGSVKHEGIKIAGSGNYSGVIQKYITLDGATSGAAMSMDAPGSGTLTIDSSSLGGSGVIGGGGILNVIGSENSLEILGVDNQNVFLNSFEDAYGMSAIQSEGSTWELFIPAQKV